MEKYITIVSLRKPAQVNPKTGTSIRSKRATAGVYDDMIDTWYYVRNNENLFDGIMPQRNSEILMSVDIGEMTQSINSATQQAMGVAQSLENMGTAAATSMRAISESLNNLQRLTTLPDPLDSVRDRVFAEAAATQMSTQEIIERLIDEYERGRR